MNPIKLFTLILVLLMFFIEWRRSNFKGILNLCKSEHQRLLLALMIGILFVIPVIFVDSFILQQLQSINSVALNHISDFGLFIGRKTTPWLFMVAFYMIALLIKQEKVSRISFSCLFSAALSVGFATIFKVVSMRNRPQSGEGPFSFFNISESINSGKLAQSFPSGDVAVVAGICGYLYFSIKQPFLRAVLLLLPLTTGLGRVLLTKHWPSDVIFAMILGFVAGNMVSKHSKT